MKARTFDARKAAQHERDVEHTNRQLSSLMAALKRSLREQKHQECGMAEGQYAHPGFGDEG